MSYKDQFQHWDDVKNKFAAYERQFPASEEDDAYDVPVVTIKDLSELEDEDAFVAMLDEKMLKANCGIIKVKMPPAYINNLRSVPQYPRLRNLHVTIEREEFTKYGSEEGVYMRNHFTHIDSTNYESIFASEMDDGFGAPFRCKAGSSWLDAEKELWRRIRANGNNKAVYAPEIEGSLYPSSFKPLNINNFTGILKQIKMVQAIVPGISQSMTYLGRAAATFPWHVEDEMLYSFNYLHFGAGKVWYAAGAGVEQYEKMVKAFQALYPEEYIHCTNAHMHKEFYVHPDILQRTFGIKIAKTVQRPGELICTRPYGFHAGFSLGNNAGEASNWGNKPLWLDTVAKEVRADHLYCDCPLTKPVILNHQSVDHSDSRKLKKRVGELERSVASLTQAIEQLKVSNAASSSSRLSLPKTEEDYGISVLSGAPRRKPGRKLGTRNPPDHNAGGLRDCSRKRKRQSDDDVASTSQGEDEASISNPSVSPPDADYVDALE